MIELKQLQENQGNAYVLFGHEAIQARPNLDPYTSTLRTNDETMQVYTSDVHIKHHTRRGIKAYAAEKQIVPPEAAIFYEKADESGNARDFKTRLNQIRKINDITTKDKKDALTHCLDLPLFGYVHAVNKENFNVTNAVNTLFRPSTFHACEILSLGRNNAFPTVNNAGEVREAAGSATVDSLEYGFFLSLWEINLNMLRVNAENHQLVKWDDTGVTGWLDIFINGLWKAYSSDRFPSFTQRSQFAQLLIGWKPGADVSFENPADLIYKLETRKIKSHHSAVEALNAILPEFLQGWGCTTDTIFAEQQAKNCPVQYLG